MPSIFWIAFPALMIVFTSLCLGVLAFGSNAPLLGQIIVLTLMVIFDMIFARMILSELGLIEW